MILGSVLWVELEQILQLKVGQLVIRLIGLLQKEIRLISLPVNIKHPAHCYALCADFRSWGTTVGTVPTGSFQYTNYDIFQCKEPVCIGTTSVQE